MSKNVLKDLCRDIKALTTRHAPEILVGLGITGMFTSGVLAVTTTPKALRRIEEEKKEKGKELTKLEVVKVSWTCYIPAVSLSLLSTACLIGAQSVNSRRNAALATAYKISETALTEYKEKVIETFGEKKHKEVIDSIAKDRIEKASEPVAGSNVIITGRGTSLCHDQVYGQYFESDYETIRRAINDLNYQLLSEQYVSLNDFYDLLGVDRIPIGDDVGWNISRHGKVEIDFSSQIAKDGRPCIVLQYTVVPQYDYYKEY